MSVSKTGSIERDIIGEIVGLEIALEILKTGDFQKRWEITKVYPRSGEKALSGLVNLLEQEPENRELIWFITKILSEFSDGESILILGKLARSEDTEIAAVAGQALGEMGEGAIATLTELLKEPKTRLVSLQALSRIHRRGIIEPLLGLMDDNSPEIRKIALETLSSFRDSRIVNSIVMALRDNSGRVRKEAVRAVTYLALHYPERDFVANLKPLLYDFDPEICKTSALALGRIGTEEAAGVLGALIRSPLTPDDLKLTVIAALGWIESPLALEYLEESLYCREEALVREAIEVLGRYGPGDLKVMAAGILVKFYRSGAGMVGKSGIDRSLALALGNLGDKSSLKVVESLAEREEESVRLHARSALKNFAVEPTLKN